MIRIIPHFIIPVLFLSGCAVMSVETGARDNIKIITYRADAPESWTGNSTMTPYALERMQAKADESCPHGYEKIKEDRIIDPPAGSRQVWTIRCK